MKNKKYLLIIFLIFILSISGLFFIKNYKNNTQTGNTQTGNTQTGNTQTILGKKYTFSDTKKINDLIDLDLSGALDNALKAYKETNGQDISNLIVLQRIYKDKGDYGESIKYGNQVLDIISKGYKLNKYNIKYGNFIVQNKSLTEIVEDNIEALIFIGDVKRAEIIYNKFSNLIELDFYNGLIKYKKGDYNSAKDIFINIKNTNPRYFVAKYLLSRIYINQQNFDKGLDILKSDYCEIEGKGLGYIICTYYRYKGLSDLYKLNGDVKQYNLYNENFNNYSKEIFSTEQKLENGEVISIDVIKSNISSAANYEK